MKNITKIFIAIFIASMFFSCKEEKKEEEKFIRPIKYQKIGYLGSEKIRTFSGTARTDKIINLSFRSSGIITKFDINSGSKVRKGQLLAKLDNAQARLSYEQAVTQLNSAKSQMNTAKSNLNRIRLLYEKGSTSLSDFETAKNSYKTAQQSYESAKRGVAIQKEQMSFGFLYAPASGIISTVNSEVDENVNPGQVVAILNAGKNMEITLGIPESIINRVKQKMEVEISFSALKNKTFKGTVTQIAPSVDANTSTYPIRVTIISPTPNIKSGMAANVKFDFGTQNSIVKKRLVVPANAVGEDSKGRFVFIVIGEGKIAKVKKQHVVIGDLKADGFEIKSGLKAGQKIATAGLQTLLDGQEVKLP